MEFYSRDLKNTDIDRLNELYALPEVTQYQTWGLKVMKRLSNSLMWF